MSIKSEPNITPPTSFTRELSAEFSDLSEAPSDLSLNPPSDLPLNPPSNRKTHTSSATSYMEQPPAISQGSRESLKRRASTSESSISKKMQALMDEVGELEQKDKNHEEERTAWSKSEAELKSQIQTQERQIHTSSLARDNVIRENLRLQKQMEELRKKLVSYEKQLGSYGKIKKLIEEDLAGGDAPS